MWSTYSTKVLSRNEENGHVLIEQSCRTPKLKHTHTRSPIHPFSPNTSHWFAKFTHLLHIKIYYDVLDFCVPFLHRGWKYAAAVFEDVSFSRTNSNGPYKWEKSLRL